MGEKDVDIRRLIDDDFYDALKLFNYVFERNESRDFWDNKHRKNPVGESVFFGGYDGDKLVAMSGFMRMEYRDGDAVYKALQACESAVDPMYRKRGLFSAVLKKTEEWAKENGIDFFMAMPNPNSRPGFLKQGWQDIGHADSWGFINHFAGWVKSADKRPVANAYLVLNGFKNFFREGRNTSFEITDMTPEEFVSEIGDNSGLGFSYSPEIIRWKLGGDGKIVRVLTGGDTAAILVIIAGNIKYIDLRKRDDIGYLGQALRQLLKDKPLIELSVDERLVSAGELIRAGFATRRDTPHARVAKGLSERTLSEGFFDSLIMQNLEED